MKTLQIVLVFAFLAAAHGFRSKNGFRKIDPTLNWRVVGGDSAEQGQFPYIVSLRGPADNHFCGGSIINSKWILTAAHCVVGADPRDITVVAGSVLLSSGGNRYVVESMILHQYNPATIENDLALLELDNAVDMDNDVDTVAIEQDDHNTPVGVTLIGWGTTSFPGSIPNNLQFLNGETISFEECESVWGGDVFRSNICTKPVMGQGACYGDSGGPLVSDDGKQVGIVSWGASCAVGRPDVYTNVAYFKDWINDLVN